MSEKIAPESLLNTWKEIRRELAKIILLAVETFAEEDQTDAVAAEIGAFMRQAARERLQHLKSDALKYGDVEMYKMCEVVEKWIATCGPGEAAAPETAPTLTGSDDGPRTTDRGQADR